MTANRDEYGDFAAHYDRHGWDWFARTYGPRLFTLLQERGVAPGRALDAGCGTGSLALALAERGWQVSGLDLSAGLLRQARAKDAAHRIRWHEGDLAAFDPAGLDGPFDLITCVADTLNHLRSTETWEAAFARLAACLAPGGALFFDFATMRGLRHMDQQGVIVSDDAVLVTAVIHDPAERRSMMRVVSLLRRESDGAWERAGETINEWGHPVAEILDRLARAGFTRVERVWGEAADPEDEDRVFVLARR